MTEQIERVCPGCGASASDFRFCPSCGRYLGSLAVISTPADRQADAPSNGDQASTVNGSHVSPERPRAEYTPPAATAGALRAIEIPAQPDASQDQSAPGASEDGHDRSATDDSPAHATLARFQTTEDSPPADAEAAEAKDDVAPQLPETLRFGYVPAAVPNGAHNGSDIAGQDSTADDGADRFPTDDAPAEPEHESPHVSAVPLRDDDQPRPRQDAPRPAPPIPTVPESRGHRVTFVCIAAVIGLILVMLSRGRRDHA
jgi:hypothetical protein